MAQKLKLNDAGKEKHPHLSNKVITEGSWQRYLPADERDSFLVPAGEIEITSNEKVKPLDEKFTWTNKGEYHDRFREGNEGKTLARREWNRKLGLNIARILISTGTLAKVSA